MAANPAQWHPHNPKVRDQWSSPRRPGCSFRRACASGRTAVLALCRAGRRPPPASPPRQGERQQLTAHRCVGGSLTDRDNLTGRLLLTAEPFDFRASLAECRARSAPVARETHPSRQAGPMCGFSALADRCSAIRSRGRGSAGAPGASRDMRAEFVLTRRPAIGHLPA